jgi:hypothetical protein
MPEREKKPLDLPSLLVFSISLIVNEILDAMAFLILLQNLHQLHR